MLHQGTLCSTANCLHRCPLQRPGEVETGPLTRVMEPGWLILKRLDLHSKRAENIQEKERETLNASGFDYAHRAQVVDTL